MSRSPSSIGEDVGGSRFSPNRVLVIDVGGTSVKVLATGQKESRSFRSGLTLTPKRMVSRVKTLVADWAYDVVSIGYPGPVLHGRPIAEPRNLGRGWVGFDFAQAFGCPVQSRQRRGPAGFGLLSGGQIALSRPGNRPGVVR